MNALKLSAFFILGSVFFILNHSMQYSAESAFLTTADLQIHLVEKGSVLRMIMCLILGVFGMVTLFAVGRRRLAVRNWVGIFIIANAIWVFLTLFWAPDPFFTFKRISVFALFCLAAFAVGLEFAASDIAVLAFWTSFCYLVAGVSVEMARNSLQILASDFRFGGTLHPNEQGVNCSVLLMAAFSLMSSEKKRRWILCIGIAIGIICLILTRSRTSMLATLLAVFAYVFYATSPYKKVQLLIYSVPVLCVFCLLLESPIDVFSRIFFIGRIDSDLDTLNSRTILWHEAIKYWAARPFGGYGFNSFWTAKHIGTISNVWAGSYSLASAHSGYIDLFLDVGLIGGVLYVAMLVFAVRASLHSAKTLNKNCLFPTLLLLFIAFHALAESDFTRTTWLNFLGICCMVNLGLQKEEGKISR
jgi:exopolysaccharide production protein ExoQ